MRPDHRSTQPSEQHHHAGYDHSAAAALERPDHTGHGHEGHAGGHDKHAGHDPEAFRRKFWLSLALTVPIVAGDPSWPGADRRRPGWRSSLEPGRK
jgi:Cu2+-exporting ATPase